MSAVPMSKLDLMTPPVVKTIQQRSLLVGLVFGVIAAVGAWLLPGFCGSPSPMRLWSDGGA